jgi:hypothetical protein
MKLLTSLYIVVSFLVLANPVLAADAGSITITSPANGAMLASGSGNKLDFSIHLGPGGNHVHIYVDDQSPIEFRDVSHCPCSIDLPSLSPGKHMIVIKEATSSHALTGLQASVTATVK